MTDQGENKIDLEDNSDQQTSNMSENQDQEKEQSQEQPQGQNKESGGSMLPSATSRASD